MDEGPRDVSNQDFPEVNKGTALSSATDVATSKAVSVPSCAITCTNFKTEEQVDEGLRDVPNQDFPDNKGTALSSATDVATSKAVSVPSCAITCKNFKTEEQVNEGPRDVPNQDFPEVNKGVALSSATDVATSKAASVAITCTNFVMNIKAEEQVDKGPSDVLTEANKGTAATDVATTKLSSIPSCAISSTIPRLVATASSNLSNANLLTDVDKEARPPSEDDAGWFSYQEQATGAKTRPPVKRSVQFSESFWLQCAKIEALKKKLERMISRHELKRKLIKGAGRRRSRREEVKKQKEKKEKKRKKKKKKKQEVKKGVMVRTAPMDIPGFMSFRDEDESSENSSSEDYMSLPSYNEVNITTHSQSMATENMVTEGPSQGLRTEGIVPSHSIDVSTTGMESVPVHATIKLGDVTLVVSLENSTVTIQQVHRDNFPLSTNPPIKAKEEPSDDLPSVPDKSLPRDHKAVKHEFSKESQDPVASLTDTTQDISSSTKAMEEPLDSLPSVPEKICLPKAPVDEQSSIAEVIVPLSTSPRSVLTNSLGECFVNRCSSKKMSISSPIVLAIPWPNNSDVSLSTYLPSSASPCIRAQSAGRRSFPHVVDGKGKVVVCCYQLMVPLYVFNMFSVCNLFVQ